MPVTHRKICLFEQAFIIYFKKKDYHGLKYIKRYMQFIKDNTKTRKKSIRFKKFPTEVAEFKFHIFSNLWAICILMICALLWYSILKQKFIRKNDNRNIWNSQGLLMTYQGAVIFLTSQITYDQNKDTGNRKKSIFFFKKFNLVGKNSKFLYISLSFCSSSMLTRLMALRWYKYEGLLKNLNEVLYYLALFQTSIKDFLICWEKKHKNRNVR